MAFEGIETGWRVNGKSLMASELIREVGRDTDDRPNVLSCGYSILEEKIVSTVPYSCCRSGSECMSAQGTTNKSVDYWTELKNVDMGSINQNGCWTAFNVKLQLLRYILCGTVLVVCVLQVRIFCL